MSTSRYAAAPIRFLLAVVGIWVAGRGAMLAVWNMPSPPKPGPSPWSWGSVGPTLFQPRATPAQSAETNAGKPLPSIQSPKPFFAQARFHDELARFDPGKAAGVDTPARSAVAPEPAILLPDPLAPPSPPDRWSGSAWLFARGEGERGLAPNGRIGGSQTGVRILYRLDDAGRLAASARLSRSLAGPRQTEAAFGLDWKPIGAIPFHLTIERRIAIDRGGRNAWALGIAGGVDAMPLGHALRLDAYAQAGAVGARRRDLYVDGAARVARGFDLGEGRSLAIGGGLFGAAQPGVARLDTGPGVVLRMPIMGRTIAIALDWRERIAGSARPGSGPAFTLGADF